jgi:hypothetical protein
VQLCMKLMESNKGGGDEQGTSSSAGSGFVCIPCRQAHSQCDRYLNFIIFIS